MVRQPKERQDRNAPTCCSRRYPLRGSSHQRGALVPATLQVPFTGSRKLFKEPFTPASTCRFAAEYAQFIAAQDVEMSAFEAMTNSLDDIG